MKVRCIANTGRTLPPDCLKMKGFTEDREFPLVIDKVYNVYAFTVLDGYPWYYICDETYSYYPVWNPAPLFAIVDHRLSSSWEFNFFLGDPAEQTEIIVAFPEWSRDRLYYDRLTNRVDRDVKIFEHHKALIDQEFSEKE